MQPNSSSNNPEDTTTNNQGNTSETQAHPPISTNTAIYGPPCDEQSHTLAEINQQLAEMISQQQSNHAEICLLLDPGEREPSIMADFTNAVGDLPIGAQMLYTITLVYAVVSYYGHRWTTYTTIGFIAKFVPLSVTLAWFHGYLIVRYNNTREPVPKGLRATVILYCWAGIIDDLELIVYASVPELWKAWAIASVVFKIGLMMYHFIMLIKQEKMGDPNWPTSNYRFVKRSFVLQAMHVINATSKVPVYSLSIDDLYIMKRCLRCSDAGINSVFNRPKARDACITIIQSHDEIFNACCSNEWVPIPSEIGPNRCKELLVSTLKALDILLGSFNR